jgi:nicotinate-nucleotide adenylyltransferase
MARENGMRVAVYGGSFNPPHVGHAMVAGWLRWTDLVDQVWLLPAFVHPFDKELAPFDRRVAMVEALAADVGPWVRVEPIEGELPSPSYTIDTLDVLAARHPAHRFRLVVGADVLDSVHLWKRWDAIVSSYAPIVVGRQGYPCPAGAIEFPGVSSTAIRARLAEGRPVDHLVPAGVSRVLHELYR